MTQPRHADSTQPWWTRGAAQVLTAGLVCVLLAVTIQYVDKSGEDRSAFNRWRRQVRELVQGEDVYQKYIYPNAPMMGLMLYPLAELPRWQIGQVTVDVGALTWFALKVGMACLAVIWTIFLVQEPGLPFPLVGRMALVFLCLRPIIGDLSHGNVNLLILFLVVAALYLFRRRRDFLAGIVLALAITCKVTPALFVPYFLWKRAWQTLLGCAAGLILFFVMIPASVLGLEHTMAITRSWIDKMILPFTIRGEVTTEHHNQSLVGLVYRLTTDSPSFYDEDDQPVAYHNLVSWPAESARLFVKVLALSFLALLFWTCRATLSPRTQTRLAAEYALVILGMLLFSERTWKHHCVTLVLPIGLLCYLLTAWPMPRWHRLLLAATLAASFLLMSTTSTSLTSGLGLGKQAAKLAQVYGAYVWAELLLLAATVLVLQCHLSPSSASPPLDKVSNPAAGATLKHQSEAA